jgi:hypothetical protein
MSWLERFGEPLAETRKEAEEYISAELERNVPAGWTVRQVEGRGLTWLIVPSGVAPGAWSDQDYGVRVPDSLDLVMFTHGNNDIGPLSLQQVLQNTLVIEAAALRHFGMAACLKHLMSRCKPNQWGFT